MDAHFVCALLCRNSNFDKPIPNLIALSCLGRFAHIVAFLTAVIHHFPTGKDLRGDRSADDHRSFTGDAVQHPTRDPKDRTISPRPVRNLRYRQTY